MVVSNRLKQMKLTTLTNQLLLACFLLIGACSFAQSQANRKPSASRLLASVLAVDATAQNKGKPLDQPRRGEAGKSPVGVTVIPTPDEQFWFTQFRLGNYPE